MTRWMMVAALVAVGCKKEAAPEPAVEAAVEEAPEVETEIVDVDRKAEEGETVLDPYPERKEAAEDEAAEGAEQTTPERKGDDEAAAE